MAATARKLELNALLNPIQKTVSGLTSTTRNLPTLDVSMGGNTLFSFALALVAVFLILLVIHYLITPIFSFTAGDGGMIPLADTTDGQRVWTKAPPLADVSANVLRILPHGFSIQQDIYIEPEPILSNRKRLFFYRASQPVVADPNQPDDLLNQYPESNLFMYLAPNTNDLSITAVTRKPDGDFLLESAPTILNVPVKQVFRLTVVFLPQVLEVYINGKLHGTRTFRYPPIITDTSFFSSPDAFRGSVRVMNFVYWDRAIRTGEIAYSKPALTDKALFHPEEMTTAQCT